MSPVLQGQSRQTVFFELALRDRNVQVRFCLKVVLKSWDAENFDTATCFHKTRSKSSSLKKNCPNFAIFSFDFEPIGYEKCWKWLQAWYWAHYFCICGNFTTFWDIRGHLVLPPSKTGFIFALIPHEIVIVQELGIPHIMKTSYSAVMSWKNINQGQLQRWTEHSTLIFENLKPKEISKNIVNIIWTSLKVV